MDGHTETMTTEDERFLPGGREAARRGGRARGGHRHDGRESGGSRGRAAARERGDPMDAGARNAGTEAGASREAPRYRGILDERGRLRVRFDDEELTLGAFLRRLRLVDDGRAGTALERG